MYEEIVKKIVDSVAREMSQFKFAERHDNVSSDIRGVVKKSWNPLRRVFGGHGLFAACSGVASELKDRSGLHMNIVQGVILVDAETREVTGDYTRPAQHKREYEAVLSATTKAVK